MIVSSDQLLQRLEGKLQQAADRAVDSALSARFSAAVNQAAKAIDEFSQSSARKVQKQYESYREQMVTSAREQFLTGVHADLATAEERLQQRVEGLLGRTEEAVRRLEASVAAVDPAMRRVEACMAQIEPAVGRVEASIAQIEPSVTEAESSLQQAALKQQYEFAARAGEITSHIEAQVGERMSQAADQQISRVNEQAQSTLGATALQLQAKLDETRGQLISVAGTALAELHVAAKNEVDQTVGESRQKVEESLASFCEDTTAGWEARLRACQDELAGSGEKEIAEFRSRLQAILNSSMIAAASAVSEHAKALLSVLAKDVVPPTHDTEAEVPPQIERQAS